MLDSSSLNLTSHKSGNVTLILGPMFSGKSTELVRIVRRYIVARKRCLVVKYHADTRYSVDAMATHDNQLLKARPCGKLSDLEDDVENYDVIGIDEAQFFPDVVDFCDRMACQGKIIVCAALDGDFQRKPFGSILELIPMAEVVTKLTAVCVGCQAPASFSRRITQETAVEVIGGADKYVATCRACYHADDLVDPRAQKEDLKLKDDLDAVSAEMQALNTKVSGASKKTPLAPVDTNIVAASEF